MEHALAPIRPTRAPKGVPAALALACALGLAGCTGPLGFSLPMIGSGAAAGPSATQDLVQTQQVLAVTETAARTVPTINGVGYAVVSAQNGKSLTHRRLLAIRAARLEAMRELTEKVHGLRIDSQTSVADAVVQSDTLRASVAGTIRGARTVRIEPKGQDTYEVLLEIDREMIDQLLRSARRAG